MSKLLIHTGLRLNIIPNLTQCILKILQSATIHLSQALNRHILRIFNQKVPGLSLLVLYGQPMGMVKNTWTNY